PLLRGVATDALEHGRPVVENVRQHVHLRVVPRDELAVHPDLLALRHRHGCRPPTGCGVVRRSGARGAPASRASRCGARVAAGGAGPPRTPRTKLQTDRTPAARALRAPATHSARAPAREAPRALRPPPDAPHSSRTRSPRRARAPTSARATGAPTGRSRPRP